MQEKNLELKPLMNWGLKFNLHSLCNSKAGREEMKRVQGPFIIIYAYAVHPWFGRLGSWGSALCETEMFLWAFPGVWVMFFSKNSSGSTAMWILEGSYNPRLLYQTWCKKARSQTCLKNDRKRTLTNIWNFLCVQKKWKFGNKLRVWDTLQWCVVWGNKQKSKTRTERKPICLLFLVL